jgi:hypothetical protein
VADDRKGELDLNVDEGRDLGLHAEMAASEFVLRHWTKGVGIVAFVIVGLLVYGQWRNVYTENQRGTTAAINDVMSELPDDLFGLAQRRVGGGEPLDIPAVEAAAGKLIDIAKGGKGTAATEAWLKAAELFRIAGNATQRRAALDGAAVGAEGVLRYSAVAALANLDLEESKTDEGLARFRTLSEDTDTFLARTASLDLASALEALGRNTEAVTVYDAFLAKWTDAPNKDDVQKRRDKAAASPDGKPAAPAEAPAVPADAPAAPTDAPATPTDAPAAPADAPPATPPSGGGTPE